MVRHGIWLIVLVFAVFSPMHARASGDGGCEPSWKVAGSGPDLCSNLAMLRPGNDTRANLLLLLADQDGGPSGPDQPKQDGSDGLAAPSDWATFRDAFHPPAAGGDKASYAAGEGSRCRSNDTGTAGFVAALNAEQGVTAGEKAELIAARQGLQPDCTGAGAGQQAVAAAAEHAQSPLAKDFAAYLSGAAAFYAGDFGAATQHFAALGGSSQPWLRESARYLLGRVDVNQLQAGAFDEFGNLKDVAQRDVGKAPEAEKALLDYLAAYPDGRYATSARGLLRRVYWISADNGKLLAEYGRLLGQKAAERGLSDTDLAEELDLKLLPSLGSEPVHDPLLLATLDLARMRKGGFQGGGSCCSAALTVDELKGQRAFFGGNAELFDYLVASGQFYIDSQPRAVLGLIADRARQKSYTNLEFSRQVLRGLALDAVNDRNARGFWLDLVQGAGPAGQHLVVELALAMHDERAGTPEHVFDAASPVHNKDIRRILLIHSAGPQLLRSEARDAAIPADERATALYALLYRDLSRGAYKDFPEDVTLVPADAQAGDAQADDAKADDAKGGDDADEAAGNAPPSPQVFLKPQTDADFACPDLRTVAASLSANPRDVAARLCLGDFIRLNDFDGSLWDTSPPKDDLGGNGLLFPGKRFSRLEAYRAIADMAGATADQKAYALYRAIRCFAPNNTNACDDAKVPVTQRKAWFQKLKHDYPRSSWAQGLDHYW